MAGESSGFRPRPARVCGSCPRARCASRVSAIDPCHAVFLVRSLSSPGTGIYAARSPFSLHARGAMGVEPALACAADRRFGRCGVHRHDRHEGTARQRRSRSKTRQAETRHDAPRGPSRGCRLAFRPMLAPWRNAFARRGGDRRGGEALFRYRSEPSLAGKNYEGLRYDSERGVRSGSRFKAMKTAKPRFEWGIGDFSSWLPFTLRACCDASPNTAFRPETRCP